jgi:hypothetical protein
MILFYSKGVSLLSIQWDEDIVNKIFSPEIEEYNTQISIDYTIHDSILIKDFRILDSLDFSDLKCINFTKFYNNKIESHQEFPSWKADYTRAYFKTMNDSTFMVILTNPKTGDSTTYSRKGKLIRIYFEFTEIND